MTFAIIFLIVFIALGVFVLYLSRTIDHGEARFDSTGKVISDIDPRIEGPVRPAQRLESNEKTGNKA